MSFFSRAPKSSGAHQWTRAQGGKTSAEGEVGQTVWIFAVGTVAQFQHAYAPIEASKTNANDMRALLNLVPKHECELKVVGSAEGIQVVENLVRLCGRSFKSVSIRRPQDTWNFDFLSGRLRLNVALATPNIAPITPLATVAKANAINPKTQSTLQPGSTGSKEVSKKGDAVAQRPTTKIVPNAEAAPVLKSASSKIKVLIVDDSPTIQNLLTQVFGRESMFEVVGAAHSPNQVFQLIESKKPDVITMDIHMPEMDGVTMVREVMRKKRTPIVMISSLSIEESTLVLDALEAGAVDYIQKPSLKDLSTVAPFIVEKVRVAAAAKVVAPVRTLSSAALIPKSSMDPSRIFAMGASTGGTEALKQVLENLGEDVPPIVIVQHIPPVFSKAFADRLNQVCAFKVKEAQDRDPLVPGQALVAPGGFQMRVEKSSSGFIVRVEDTAPVNRHKPSVDVLFDSVASVIGKKAIGVLLTGMGADGAKGLKKMRDAGSRTICQDEASSVVFGMPKEGIKLGAAEEVLPLEKVSSKMSEWAAASSTAKKAA